jgi:hypothetical protein
VTSSTSMAALSCAAFPWRTQPQTASRRSNSFPVARHQVNHSLNYLLHQVLVCAYPRLGL